MERFWTALFAGRILPMDTVESFVEPRTDVAAEKLRYGRGFWIRPDRPTVMLEGMDAGVCVRENESTAITALVHSRRNEFGLAADRRCHDETPRRSRELVNDLLTHGPPRASCPR